MGSFLYNLLGVPEMKKYKQKAKAIVNGSMMGSARFMEQMSGEKG
jgi:hypothetical protein